MKDMSDLLGSIGDYVSEVGVLLLTMPLVVEEKFHFVYLLTFVGLGWISYHRYYRHRTRKNFWQFLFPRRTYLHPSSRVDYGVFLINILTSPLLLVGVALQTAVSSQVGAVLLGMNDGQALVVGDWNLATYAVFILGFTLAADLSVYLVHRLHHASHILWPLHALHHSAEVMTPVTLFRKHPLWNVLARTMHLLLTGLFQGVFFFFFFGNPGVEILFGINTIYVAYNFFGANLRHSHVWLSWGWRLSHIFISPAMHQIHHDPERMNKNYGEVFAIWDWIFGTLYVPRESEQFKIGLPEGNPHQSLWQAYWVPVRDVARVLVARLKGSHPSN